MFDVLSLIVGAFFGFLAGVCAILFAMGFWPEPKKGTRNVPESH